MPRSKPTRKPPQNAAAQGKRARQADRREKKSTSRRPSPPTVRGTSKVVKTNGSRIETDRNWIVRGAYLFADYCPDFLVAVGAATVGLTSLLMVDGIANYLAGIPSLGVTAVGIKDVSAAIRGGGVAVGFIGAVGAIIKKKRVSELETELESVKSEAEELEQERAKLSSAALRLLDSYLGVLAIGQLEFTYNERISLYVHDGNSGFTRAGRFALNPSLRGTGRVYYPDHEGCIGKAWTGMSFFSGGYPDPDSDPEGYLSRCEIDGLPGGTARVIKMKSRCMGAYTIRNSSGLNPLAVIVVESLHPDRYSKAELDAIFLNSETARYLSEFLGIFRDQLPDFTNAAKTGF